MRRKRPSWAEVEAMRFESQREVCAFVAKHIHYRPDPAEDDWKAPALTWADGRGDCEDIALVVRHLCHNSSIVAVLHLLFPPKKAPGHAVVGGNGWVASNARFRRAKDLKAAVAREHGWKPDMTFIITPSEEYIAGRLRHA